MTTGTSCVLGIIDEFKYAMAHTDKPLKATCAGPLTFGSRIHPGDQYKGTVDIAERFCEVINAELKGLVAAGAEFIQIDEPARGNVSGQEMARLVQVDHHRLDAFLDGILLIFTHRDVPGIIGRVGTIFGEHRVNIAQMAVGRAAPGGEAIGVLNLDNMPSAESLRAVTAIPDITSVQVVQLPAAGELPAWLGG